MKRTLCVLLTALSLLCGCGRAADLPAPSAAPAQTAAPETPVSGTAAPENPTPESSVPEPSEPLSAAVPVPSAGPSVLVRLERTTRETMDPAEGKEKILTFSWDSVQVSSETSPDAARQITETMALLQDLWYTGSDEEGAAYGYNAMLELAEDNYAIAREYGGPVEFSASRTVKALRADENICVFLVNDYSYLGGAHGTYMPEAFCFDMQTGQRLRLDDLSQDPELLRARLLDAMLRLAQEDAEEYYSEHLALTDPEDYPEAFSLLLREGSWYPGAEGFCVFSGLYELGPYAAGITEFFIPYGELAEALDPRWIPKTASDRAVFSFCEAGQSTAPLAGSVVIGDGGESCILGCEGDARDVSLWTCGFSGSFYPERQLFYCDILENEALQLALLFPGDLPDTMLRYRDAEGEHEYLLSISGEDGSLQLLENS